MRLIVFQFKNTTFLCALLFGLKIDKKKETRGCAEQNNLVRKYASEKWDICHTAKVIYQQGI